MGWDVGFEHSLKVRRASSHGCSIGKHQGLEDSNWKPVDQLLMTTSHLCVFAVITNYIDTFN